MVNEDRFSDSTILLFLPIICFWYSSLADIPTNFDRAVHSQHPGLCTASRMFQILGGLPPPPLLTGKTTPASPGNYLGYMEDDDVGLVYSLSS